ncbi:uncharacterized protein LOC110437506 [Sorghum bicolor]|nr:uncharacterized protein LOC110437506 [Sorghum bicolor]|eukprot:XP_021321647.1 uncharacterized protein LOC110437506 [Sorghum bicolor]
MAASPPRPPPSPSDSRALPAPTPPKAVTPPTASSSPFVRLPLRRSRRSPLSPLRFLPGVRPLGSSCTTLLLLLLVSSSSVFSSVLFLLSVLVKSILHSSWIAFGNSRGLPFLVCVLGGINLEIQSLGDEIKTAKKQNGQKPASPSLTSEVAASLMAMELETDHLARRQQSRRQAKGQQQQQQQRQNAPSPKPPAPAAAAAGGLSAEAFLALACVAVSLVVLPLVLPPLPPPPPLLLLVPVCLLLLLAALATFVPSADVRTMASSYL